MPRIPRGQQAGFVYHVINRGNGRATIFHKAQDYFGLRLFQTFETACPESYRRVQSLRSVQDVEVG
jgi:putative transposase